MHTLSTEEVKTLHRSVPAMDQACATRVWDTYKSDSLKESTREKRVRGVRRKVSGHAKLPLKFHNSKNKQELFDFLTQKVSD